LKAADSGRFEQEPAMNRFSIQRHYPAMQPLVTLGQRIHDSGRLEPAMIELVLMRVSQINGCAFCLDMHWKDARASGQSEERLYMLSTWRESSLYSERERAALELCEAMTVISKAQVPDDVWERASTAFDEYELSQLVFAITTINAWNRLNIATLLRPGHYEPGMFDHPTPARAADKAPSVEVGGAASS
jgi:AhpD family alkylhydroperoxidase